MPNLGQYLTEALSRVELQQAEKVRQGTKNQSIVDTEELTEMIDELTAKVKEIYKEYSDKYNVDNSDNFELLFYNDVLPKVAFKLKRNLEDNSDEQDSF